MSQMVPDGLGSWQESSQEPAQEARLIHPKHKHGGLLPAALAPRTPRAPGTASVARDPRGGKWRSLDSTRLPTHGLTWAERRQVKGPPRQRPAGQSQAALPLSGATASAAYP